MLRKSCRLKSTGAGAPGVESRAPPVVNHSDIRTQFGHFMAYNPPLIFGPIAPENNPPITPQYYQPSVFDIAAITNGTTTLVTTVVNNNYVVGQLVRLLVSQLYGARQFNEQTAYVININSSTQFTLGLDSSSFDVFVANPTSGTTQPQVVAVGDVNSGPINSHGRMVNGTFIPGSFINISPL